MSSVRTPRIAVPFDRVGLVSLADSAFSSLGNYGEALGAWLDDERVTAYVIDGEVAGLSAMALLAVASDAQPVYAYLLAIATAPELRRQGLARALLSCCIEASRASPLGPKYLELAVADGNNAARALFVSLGFHPVDGPPLRYPRGERARTLRHPLG